MGQKIIEEVTKHKLILREHEKSGKTWRIYTDGSCKDGNTSKARARVGAYCSEDEPKTKAIKVPGRAQTNQRAELIAILTAIESVKKEDDLEIISDSKYALKEIIEGIQKWMDKGWINVENKDIFKRIAYSLDTRGARTTFKWVKGHSGNEGNKRVDKKAEEGANKEVDKEVDLTIPKEYMLEGAKLNKLTQKLAYLHVLEQKQIKAWTPTGERNMNKTRQQIKEMLGYTQAKRQYGMA